MDVPVRKAVERQSMLPDTEGEGNTETSGDNNVCGEREEEQVDAAELGGDTMDDIGWTMRYSRGSS